MDLPSSLLGGEALLAKVYNAVRTSASATGSSVYNTLLMINFDEHGGTYDHVPPPPVPPPDPAGPGGQYGFSFDRSGLRVPAIAISPWIAERTVVNDEYRHTSVIRTLRERWSLGAPFTARDGSPPTSHRCSRSYPQHSAQILPGGASTPRPPSPERIRDVNHHRPVAHGRGRGARQMTALCRAARGLALVGAGVVGAPQRRDLPISRTHEILGSPRTSHV
jgi:phospholipase C